MDETYPGEFAGIPEDEETAAEVMAAARGTALAGIPHAKKKSEQWRRAYESHIMAALTAGASYREVAKAAGVQVGAIQHIERQVKKRQLSAREVDDVTIVE